MNILLPKTITAAMIGAGTNIPEVDAAVGEVLWATGGTFTVGQRRVWDGYTYECVQAITGAPANTYQPNAATAAPFWLKDEGAPTNRTAPFDKYLFTKARRTGSITYVLNVGFATGLAIYGIEGDTLAITVKAGPGGANLIPPVAVDLWAPAFGEFEYLFGDLQRGTYYTLKNLPLHPAAEITITVSRNTPAEQAAIGFISVGTWKRLLAPQQSGTGGAQYGVEASTKDYGYTKDYDDGTYVDVPGRKSTNINLSCVIDADQAPAAKALLDQILGKAVAVEVSDLPKYSHLATVAKVTGSIRTTSWATADVALQIKGNT